MYMKYVSQIITILWKVSNVCGEYVAHITILWKVSNVCGEYVALITILLRVSNVSTIPLSLCQTIARVTADPDYLPRSIDFGLNVEAFHKRFCEDVPEPYFMLAVLCSQLEPDQR